MLQRPEAETRADVQRSWCRVGGRNWDLVWGSKNQTSHRELIHSKDREVRRERTAERLKSTWAD